MTDNRLSEETFAALKKRFKLAFSLADVPASVPTRTQHHPGEAVYEATDLVLGATYVLHVGSSWLIAGTVLAVTAEHVSLVGCVYLESVTSGHATVSSLPPAVGPAQKKIMGQTWAMPDRTLIKRDFIIFANPCVSDVYDLWASKQANVLGGVT